MKNIKVGGLMKIEVAELMPFLDDRLLTEELLIELGFEEVVAEDLVDKSKYTYYTYNEGSENVPSLYADKENGKWEVRLNQYDHLTESPYWVTYGGVRMLTLSLIGEGNEPQGELTNIKEKE